MSKQEKNVKSEQAPQDGRLARFKEKLALVRGAIDQIHKEFGKGAVMLLDGEAESAHQSTGVIPTGSVGLDCALGVGGYARGRIVEIFGPESSGKTTLMLHAIAQVQAQGGVAAFIDAEHALDVTYARKLGVKVDELLISQPDTGEQALEIAETLVRSGAVDMIVVDSVAALVPRAELEGDMGDSHVGLHARLMSQALRKLTGVVSKSNATVVFINQLRMKIGVMFGNPETTPGGNALKFYSSVRLEVRKVTTIKEREETVGTRVKARVVKNKVAPPFRTAEFDLMHDRGISKEGDLIDLAIEDKIIDKSGAWLNYGDVRLGQGRENAKQFLRDNPALLDEISKKILEKRGLLGNPTEMNGEAEHKPEPAPAPKTRKQAAPAD